MSIAKTRPLEPSCDSTANQHAMRGLNVKSMIRVGTPVALEQRGKQLKRTQLAA